MYFLLLKMQLKIDTVYAVDSEHETFIGTYRGDVSNRYFAPFRNILWDVKVKIKQKTNNSEPILVRYVSINNNDNVYDLLRFKNKQEQQKLVQIINQYHKNITPEIQELLDRYFHEI